MMEKQRFFSLTGFYLWLGSVFGAVCLLPYVHALTPEKFDEAAEQFDLAIPMVIALSLIQSAVLLKFVTFSGLWAARKLGLGAPLLDAVLRGENPPYNLRLIARNAIVLGIAVALLIAVLDGMLTRLAEPNSFDSLFEQQPAPWKGFLASFYGGIAEEVQIRLFVLSFIALGLRAASRLFTRSYDFILPGWVFWTANFGAAILFGLGHLPITAELTALTPLIVIRAILLNGIFGLLAGFLYWRRGIEIAILFHFSSDVMLHVFLPMLL